MPPESFPLQAYLSRVGLESPPSVDTAGLRTLMRAQLFTVPFENTYVQAGLDVSLEPSDIIEKIIYQRRGGYCYEVNGLFAWAAAALGFSVRLIGARPMFYPKRWAKTHMVVLVDLPEGRYVCDTGFGRFGLRAPIRLDASQIPVQQDWDQFRLVKDSYEWIVQAFNNGEWESQFSFDEYPAEWADFMPANYFNSHSPDTIFVQKLLVIQHEPQARVILLDDNLKIIRAEEIEEYTLSESLAERVLRFGLTWPQAIR
jgi:N-hydroxyarylamine O-acetyltransferase